MDGNDRMGRFLMNLMLASGGYPWTVIPVGERKTYMDALEKASVGEEIVPFADFLAGLVKKGLAKACCKTSILQIRWVEPVISWRSLLDGLLRAAGFDRQLAKLDRFRWPECVLAGWTSIARSQRAVEDKRFERCSANRIECHASDDRNGGRVVHGFSTSI